MEAAILTLIAVNLLTFGMFGAAIFFAIKAERSRSSKAMRNVIRQAKRTVERVESSNAEYKAEVAKFRAELSHVLQKPIPPVSNPYTRMQDRGEIEASRVVKIGNEEVSIG